MLKSLGLAAAVALAGAPWGMAQATNQAPSAVPSPAGHPAPASARAIDINEYRVEGSERLAQGDLEAALEPFLGPGRTLEDVERARAALEKTYSDKGFQSVSVAIPPQTVREGVVTLKVTEGKVGRLRVRGSRYFSLSDIKRQAPSVAEGQVPNFDHIVRDVVALNQLPNRRVTPALRAGAVPGTVDVDLNVQDTLPLHGSLEVNNRYSSDTTHARLAGSFHYDNLWQLGHSLTFSFQVAPKRVQDGKVFSASYLARFPAVQWLTLTLSGVLQNSEISTLGSIGVKGKGRIVGGRASFTLPGTPGFFHTVSAGVDYKHFDEGITLGEDALETPITYWPFTLQYGATWPGESSQTQAGVTVVANLRGLSSGTGEFDAKRYKASGSFIYYRAEVSRTDEVRGIQLFERVQGQYSGDPLLSSEQLTAGGTDTVRGYAEVQGSGDYGAVGTFELRGPSLAKWFGKPVLNEWRFLAFVEGGRLVVRDALPDQKSFSRLLSAGGGSRIRLLDHLSGSVDVGVPLVSEGGTRRYHPRVHFRLCSEF